MRGGEGEKLGQADGGGDRDGHALVWLSVVEHRHAALGVDVENEARWEAARGRSSDRLTAGGIAMDTPLSGCRLSNTDTRRSAWPTRTKPDPQRPARGTRTG